MDALGGISKSLMFACVTPASSWADETFSTLTYAASTMKIKNKPIVQMDSKEAVVFNLKKEYQLLKEENAYYRAVYNSITGGMPVLESPMSM